MVEEDELKKNLELTAALADGSKDANTFAGTFVNGIAPAGQSVPLQTSQFYNPQTMVHIALSGITVPLAVLDLWDQYQNLNELQNKNFDAFSSPQPPKECKTPEMVNKEIIFLRKMQLSSSATNFLIGLAFTSIVVASIFTGGLALGVVGVVALGVGIAKIGMDIYIKEKEKTLAKEFFESKVFNKMSEDEFATYNKKEPVDKTLYVAKKALDLNDKSNFPESEVKEYLLKSREGHFTNAKMKNAQLAFTALGMGTWLTLSFVTAGLAGIVTLGVATLGSAGLSIVNTEKAQNLLGPKVTEWFRTIFSRKKDSEYAPLDYKNRNIDNFMVDLKRTPIEDLTNSQSSSSSKKIMEGLGVSPDLNADKTFQSEKRLQRSQSVDFNKTVLSPEMDRIEGRPKSLPSNIQYSPPSTKIENLDRSPSPVVKCVSTNESAHAIANTLQRHKSVDLSLPRNELNERPKSLPSNFQSTQASLDMQNEENQLGLRS